MPPVHLLLTHWLLLAHDCPFAKRHAPAPLQALAPLHVLSVPFKGMFEHVPCMPAMLHAWQVFAQLELQQ